AGILVIRVRVGCRHDGVRLAKSPLDVPAVESRACAYDGLFAGGEEDHCIDDPANWCASVDDAGGGRQDVRVDADRLGVIALVADLYDDVLLVRSAIAQDDGTGDGYLL